MIFAVVYQDGVEGRFHADSMSQAVPMAQAIYHGAKPKLVWEIADKSTQLAVLYPPECRHKAAYHEGDDNA